MVDHNEIDAELQQAVQAIASQLQLLHTGAAELLLGTNTLAEDIDPQEIDVAALGITQTLHNARDFAWAPEQLITSGFGVDDLQDLICFVDGLPALGGQGDNVPKENLRLVRCAAEARANILGFEIGPEAGDFEGFSDYLTVPQIAALAQLGERSVRNAVSRGELRANGRVNDEPTFPVRSVYPWLLNRRSFVPWPDTDAGLRRLVTQALDAQTRARFAHVATQLASSVSKDRLPAGSERILDGSFEPDVALLKALGDALDLPDSAAFVGHAITLALREQVA